MNSNRFETWRTIKDYPMYKISSYGRVMNVTTDEILKQRKYNGYYQVKLSNKNSKDDRHYIQNLVYNAFNGSIHQFTKIEHIDGDVSNNSFWNLRIVDMSEPLKEVFIKLTPNEITKLSSKPLIYTLIYTYIKNITYNIYGNKTGLITLKLKNCINKFGSLIECPENFSNKDLIIEKCLVIIDILQYLKKCDLIYFNDWYSDEVRLTLIEN